MGHYVTHVNNFNEVQNQSFPIIVADGNELKVVFDNILNAITKERVVLRRVMSSY